MPPTRRLSSMPILIRNETPEDVDNVRAVNRSAFPTDAEARLVDALRKSAEPLVSLVAVDGDELVGHILFSPASLESSGGRLVMGLAPMAVQPDRQRQGIGSALVERGIEACRKLGAVAIVVLGFATYYPRFGFTPASRYGVHSEYDVPDDVFMLLELGPGAVSPGGIARYHEAFGNL